MDIQLVYGECTRCHRLALIWSLEFIMCLHCVHDTMTTTDMTNYACQVYAEIDAINTPTD